ncbi:MAG: class I SAM-dependent methyltransferase [Pseudomonadota bacterium]
MVQDYRTVVTQDYLTDVPYTAGFYGEQSPAHMNYIAALNGWMTPRLDQAFTCCELGSGQGLTLNTLAAAYDNGRFFGVDFNPEHVRNSRAMAAQGQLSNATFIDKSFTDLDGVDLPDFDFVTLHGVYTWVSREVRQAIVDFLKRKLKAGGVAYVSYNAFPGWAALAPLREIMLAFTAPMNLNSVDKAKQGLAYLKFLRDKKAKYFTDNPSAGGMLDFIEKRPINYVAHEYFNANWNPMYFGDVARDLRAAGLVFAGNSPVSMNYRDLTIPAAFQDIIKTAPDRVVYETHRDFVLNAQFRRDIYVKPSGPQHPEADRRFLYEHMHFGTALLRDVLLTKITLAGGELNLQGPIYPALIDRLARGAWSLAELEGEETLKAYTPADILEGVKSLVAGGQFAACARGAPPAADGSAARLTIPVPLNRVLLETRMFTNEPFNLASPVVGNGISLPMIDGLAILALANASAEEAPEWAWSFLAKANRSLSTDKGPVQGREANIAMIRPAVDSVLGPRLVKLIECGLVARA